MTSSMASIVLRPLPAHEQSNELEENASANNIDLADSNELPTRKYQILLVLSGFLMTFHVIGINSIYGLFQEFYTSPQTNISDGRGRDALVSLVGTIGTGLTWSGSIFVNPLMARVDRLMLITLSGAFIMSMGIFLASFSTKLWHLFLTQALLYGIGSSLYYFPIMSLTPAYFDRHRGAAMGIVLAGSGVGGLVLAPVFHLLLDRYGIRWALRIPGIWNFVLGIPVASVLTKKSARSFGAFLQAAENLIPIYFLTTYSVSVLSYSSTTGSLLLAINTAVNSVSRIIMGILADRVGRQNTMVLTGGYNALLPTTITEVYGVQNYASVNSFIYFIRGMGAIFGAPIAGLILGSYQRGTSYSSGMLAAGLEALKSRYNDVAVFAGILLLASGACVACVRWLDARDKGAWAWRA
ncbi:MFS general substrate transporter [Sparassis latifolia]